MNWAITPFRVGLRLPPAWQLSVAAEGYRPYTVFDLELTPDEPRAINIRLEAR